MKRSKHLEPLSHDHYEGLLVAGRLQKGLSKHASPDVMAAYVAHFWKTHLAHHFRQEETLLPPVLAGIGAVILAERMVEEHRIIRELVALARDDPDRRTQTLAELSQMMKAHIRFEERELFPALEQRASKESLQELDAQLQTAYLEADLSWDPAFWE